MSKPKTKKTEWLTTVRLTSAEHERVDNAMWLSRTRYFGHFLRRAMSDLCERIERAAAREGKKSE